MISTPSFHFGGPFLTSCLSETTLYHPWTHDSRKGIFDDNQINWLSYHAKVWMYQIHPYTLDNWVDHGHTSRQICHMLNNHGLIIDWQHISWIDISDDCHMHLSFATVLSALPSMNTKIYLFASFGSLGPEITRARNINPSFRYLLGARLYDITKTNQQEYAVLSEL
jgi:hypothetical protein